MRLMQSIPSEVNSKSLKVAHQIVSMLSPYHDGEEPGAAERMVVQAYALDLARVLAANIIEEGLGSDRIGQCIRNLFECLGRTSEGAEMGKKTGEVQILRRH